MTTRANPCRGREAGCTQDCPEGSRCDNCRALHNAREKARQADRKAAGKCVACGHRAVVVEGVSLTLCKAHREYYRARAAGGP